MTQHRLLLPALLLCLPLACGGNSDSGLTGSGGSSGSGGAADSGTGGAAGSGTGGAAGSGTGGAAGDSGGAGGASGGAAGSGGGASYTLDNVCQLVAPKICAGEQSCCQSSGFGFDQAKCEAYVTGGCLQDVAEVKNGNMTFNPDNIDACLAVYKSAYDKCVLGLDDYIALVKDLNTCDTFVGKVPVGGSCTRDSECVRNDDPNVFVGCGETSKKCQETTILGANAACQIGAGVTAFCDNGLYCDVAIIGQPPYDGQCAKSTPEGQPCNGQKLIDLECGVGYYCNKSTSVCTQAKVGGAACVQDSECLSFSCAVGHCVAVEPIVDQASCTGTP